MLSSQLGRGRPAPCGRGPARFCRVSRLKAVGEVWGLRAFACRSARWGVAAARAGDVWGARARRRIAAATLQRVWLPFVLNARAEAQRCVKTWQRPSQWWVESVDEVCLSADAARCSKRAVFSFAGTGRSRPEAAEVFRPNATHASAGASLRVAGAFWARFVASRAPWLLPSRSRPRVSES